jgi:hypothetical protein
MVWCRYAKHEEVMRMKNLIDVARLIDGPLLDAHRERRYDGRTKREMRGSSGMHSNDSG